jgi:hypothetical protein
MLVVVGSLREATHLLGGYGKGIIRYNETCVYVKDRDKYYIYVLEGQTDGWCEVVPTKEDLQQLKTL